jgi:hypothetical protein
MKSPLVKYLAALAGIAALAAVASAQETKPVTVASTIGTDSTVNVPAAKPAPKPVEDTMIKRTNLRYAPPPIEIQHLRPADKRGLNIFESPKEEGVAYTGFKLGWGAAFTQQYQALNHSNTAAPKYVNGVDANKLIEIGPGFNNAVANLYMNAQLARGIRVSLNTNLSSRHHNETWVNDGYLLIDASPIDVAALNNLMKYLTLRVGHFEVNYGDVHFRRTDNGNAMYNPFVGNYIMDAYTTEIGAEAYLRANGWLAMAGLTGGEIRGQVTKPNDRAMTFLGKVGYDKQINPDMRVRITGSLYQTPKSVSNTLYSGDRAGSRYYDVLENTASTESANAWSGAIQPGFKSKVRALVLNPFIKFQGLELFGNIEQAEGRAATETASRTWKQNVGEVVYRFLDDQLFVGGRYNTAKGRLIGIANDVGVNRYQVGGGWFITPNVMLKGEYVNQKYNDFPTTDIRNGGKFSGTMFEGVVAF